MSKNPILPLYYNDIDRSTRTWTDEEFGAYMRLLIEQWDKGGLPNNYQKLTRLATSLDTNWPMLKEKFPLVDGLLKNPVMEEIREKRSKHSEKQKENVRKRYQTSTKPPTKKLPLENEYENEIENKDRKEGVETIRNLTDESKQVLEALMEKFGVSEMNDYPIFTKLHSFVSVLQSRNEIGKLIKQAKAYWIYKEKSGDKTHGPLGFIGTIEKKYEDGGWCADNWVHKLNNFKENGKSNSKDADQRNSDREAELADLMAEKFGT